MKNEIIKLKPNISLLFHHSIKLSHLQLESILRWWWFIDDVLCQYFSHFDIPRNKGEGEGEGKGKKKLKSIKSEFLLDKLWSIFSMIDCKVGIYWGEVNNTIELEDTFPEQLVAINLFWRSDNSHVFHKQMKKSDLPRFTKVNISPIISCFNSSIQHIISFFLLVLILKFVR